MSRGNAPVRLVVLALLLGAVLSACTDQDAKEAPGAGHDATEEPVDPYAVPTLPDGDLTVHAVVKGRATQRSEQTLGQGQVVAGADQFLVIAPNQQLVALDRESGELAWQIELEGGGDRDNGACPVVAPPDGATAFVVFSGLSCGNLDRYSLADGEHLGSDQATGGLSPRAVGPAAVAGHVFWGDDNGINRVEPDGTSTLVTAPEQLGAGGDAFVASLTAVAGSDVLLVEVTSGSGSRSRLVGLRVGADGGLEELWNRDPRQVYGRESMLDNTAVRTTMDGVLVDTVERGVVTPRMLMPDPETGRTDRRTFELEQDPPGGFPAWIEADFPDEIQVSAAGQVFSPAGAGGFGYNSNVVRYDLVADEIAWVWKPRFHPSVPGVSGRALGVSEDGEHVYALWSAYSESRVVELDHETGRLERDWAVPASAADLIHHAHALLAGNQLVLFPTYDDERTRTLAVLLEVE